MQNQKHIGLVGSRQLPAIYKIRIKQVAKCLLDKGYNIASGGAMGADNYALESLLELGVASRGVIFSPWTNIEQFPWAVRKTVGKFASLGGQIIWGDVQPFAPYEIVADGLRSRNVRLVSKVAGLVAFISGNSRGTISTIRQAIQRKVPVVAFLCDPYGLFPKFDGGQWQLLKTGGCWENGFKWQPGFAPTQNQAAPALQPAKGRTQRPVVAPTRQQAAATLSLPIGAAR